MLLPKIRGNIKWIKKDILKKDGYKKMKSRVPGGDFVGCRYMNGKLIVWWKGEKLQVTKLEPVIKWVPKETEKEDSANGGKENFSNHQTISSK